MSAITFRRQDENDGWIVFVDGERLGFVRAVDGRWHATDTYFEAMARSYRTRRDAVQGLLRRKAHQARRA